MQVNLRNVHVTSACVAFRRCWIYRTNAGRGSGNYTKTTYLCQMCTNECQPSVTQGLGSTMHICFVLSQIPGCSQSWCYSYTHNSKGPLDQLLKVTITHQEYWAQHNYTANYLRLQWGQSKSMFSLSDGDFPFSDDLCVQYWHWNTRNTLFSVMFWCFY